MKTNLIRAVSQTALLLLLTLLGSSCAHTKAYVEPVGPAESFAVVQADAPVWIRMIDGRKVSNKGAGDHKEFKVLPGAHVLQVSLSGIETVETTDHGETLHARRRFQSLGSAELKFTAEAGENYLIGYKKETPGYHDISGKWWPVLHAFQPLPPALK
ncbi:MAG: hypothetical protein H7Y43_04165 [Akkermansiaceae bacterium]|nr:hypothetical protein [Verrucomicrobiales bacterium]